MSLDGRFLKHLAAELDQQLKTGRLQKVSQLGKTDFLFAIRAHNQNQKLYMSLSTSLARVNLTTRNYPSDYTPGGFCMFLRKHLEGSIIRHIRTLNDDRILEIECEGKNDIGDLVTLYLVMEMFSRYTNLILLDETRSIINAFNHVSPFDKSSRTIVGGIPYPLPDVDKVAPDDYPSIRTFLSEERTYKELVEEIQGISPLFAKYVVEQANHHPKKLFDVYQKANEEAVVPTMTTKGKTDFYYFDIFSKNQRTYASLSELLDVYYDEASSLERVKQIHKYLNTFTKRELKRKKNKLEKLSNDLETAKNNDIWRIKGDILITDQHKIHRGDSHYNGHSYELDQPVEIELDQLLTPIQNANKYYTKYKKQKTAVQHIENQIAITKDEIVYLDDLVSQIDNTHDLNDLLEIQDELGHQGFLPKKKASKSKKKPNFDLYYDVLGTAIAVGKNNLQNNYLTHTYAHKDDWWFHVKGQTGSHVIVRAADELPEETIRTAALLAAYYSKSRHSGSVPVDFTRVRHIKKVPGTLGSFVTYTHHRTIYIDPDPEEVAALTKKK